MKKGQILALEPQKGLEMGDIRKQALDQGPTQESDPLEGFLTPFHHRLIPALP